MSTFSSILFFLNIFLFTQKNKYNKKGPFLGDLKLYTEKIGLNIFNFSALFIKLDQDLLNKKTCQGLYHACVKRYFDFNTPTF